MTKFDVITCEYEYCGECPHVDCRLTNLKSMLYCIKVNKRINKKILWRGFPDWCPLEEK